MLVWNLFVCSSGYTEFTARKTSDWSLYLRRPPPSTLGKSHTPPDSQISAAFHLSVWHSHCLYFGPEADLLLICSYCLLDMYTVSHLVSGLVHNILSFSLVAMSSCWTQGWKSLCGGEATPPWAAPQRPGENLHTLFLPLVENKLVADSGWQI